MYVLNVFNIYAHFCFVHSIFRFCFLVTFGNKVTKIQKYYVIFFLHFARQDGQEGKKRTDEFVFGRTYGLTILFRDLLTFNKGTENWGCNVIFSNHATLCSVMGYVTGFVMGSVLEV
jgi:hypothetical protein